MDKMQGDLNNLLLKIIRDKNLDYSICDNFTHLIETNMVCIETYKQLSGKQKKNCVMASIKLVIQIKISNEVVRETLVFILEQVIESVLASSKGYLKINKQFTFCW